MRSSIGLFGEVLIGSNIDKRIYSWLADESWYILSLGILDAPRYKEEKEERGLGSGTGLNLLILEDIGADRAPVQSSQKKKK